MKFIIPKREREREKNGMYDLDGFTGRITNCSIIRLFYDRANKDLIIRSWK